MKKTNFKTFINNELKNLSKLDTTNLSKLSDINSYRVDTFIIAKMIVTDTYRTNSKKVRVKELSHEAIQLKHFHNFSFQKGLTTSNKTNKELSERSNELQKAHTSWERSTNLDCMLKKKYLKKLKETKGLYSLAEKLHFNKGNLYQFVNKEVLSALSVKKLQNFLVQIEKTNYEKQK